MKIILNKKEVFTYSASDLSVGIHTREGNWYPNIEIVFSNPGQVYHFKEMLDLMLEKLDYFHDGK